MNLPDYQLNRIPVSTYRLQFSADFTFAHARAIIPYLSALGITDIYASPISRARSGSSHGYDVVDPTVLNPELGTIEEFNELTLAVKAENMGWLQDIVPNHMAFHSQNSMLMDVLENGPESRYVNFFDIDWNHRDESLRGKVLAPFLGSFLGKCLEDGEIRLDFSDGAFSLRYYELILPVRLESYATILAFNLATLRKRLGHDNPDFIKFLGTLYVLKNLPSREDPADRYDQIPFVKALLSELYASNGIFKLFVDENIRIFNGEKGVPESFNRLAGLLAEQNYRLAFWKVGTEEINYRRFFAVNELISLRVEDPEVFKTVHALPFKLLEEGKITGLRVDHIDGLHDPVEYLATLRAALPATYIVVEKILQYTESLRSGWPVQGTTGYDFLNRVNGIFCRSDHREDFFRIYRAFTGLSTSYSKLEEEKKRLIIEKDLSGSLENLAHELKALAGKFRYGSDFTLFGLRRALEEILVHFPVYRTYFGPGRSSEEDAAVIRKAMSRARWHLPIQANEIEFIESMVLDRDGSLLTREEKQYAQYFTMRLQQFTSPLMAKGIEDTLLYVFNPLLSLNEVGGEPARFGTPLEDFHASNEERARTWPHGQNATQTHDTKRGEHLRARINVLSEFPEEWESNLIQWHEINSHRLKVAEENVIPDRNDEYFLYQTLLGAYPLLAGQEPGFIPRIREYLVKAVREAKMHTAWLKPDLEYEKNFLEFTQGILEEGPEGPFLKAFLPFQKKVRFYGYFNSLSQTLIKLASPGIPDFYQGTELWDLSLVDPDNRRPVDYALRADYLAETKRRDASDREAFLRDLLDNLKDGRAKFFLVHKALWARKKHGELFARGDYGALYAEGRHADSIVAFARGLGKEQAVAVAPRFLGGVVEPGRLPLGMDVWQDTKLNLPEIDGSWTNVLTGETLSGGETLPMGELLRKFPVALLLRSD